VKRQRAKEKVSNSKLCNTELAVSNKNKQTWRAIIFFCGFVAATTTSPASKASEKRQLFLTIHLFSKLKKNHFEKSRFS
jgi:hypothetical protein